MASTFFSNFAFRLYLSFVSVEVQQIMNNERTVNDLEPDYRFQLISNGFHKLKLFVFKFCKPSF